MYVIHPDVVGTLCIFAEARGEPFEGQVAVGNVIRNRTRLRHFSDGTVHSTVFWPYQFSWMNTKDGQRTRVLAAKDNDPAFIRAARAWSESAHEFLVGDAVFYHADYVDPAWRSEVDFVRQIGRHLFYARR